MFVAQHTRRTLAFGLLGCAALLGAPRKASADVIFYVDTVITGAAPSGTPPWMTVTFANTATPGQVTMTIQNLLQGPDEFVTDFYFNVDPNIAAMTIVNTGGQAPATIFPYSQGAYGQPSFGDEFDVRIDFQTNAGPDRFTDNETSVYLLSGVGLAENSFSFTTPSNAGPQYMVTHIQGIQGSLSGHLGGGTTTTTTTTTGVFSATATGPSETPEPISLVLWGGLGATLLVAARRRKKAA